MVNGNDYSCAGVPSPLRGAAFFLVTFELHQSYTEDVSNGNHIIMNDTPVGLSSPPAIPISMAASEVVESRG